MHFQLNRVFGGAFGWNANSTQLLMIFKAFIFSDGNVDNFECFFSLGKEMFRFSNDTGKLRRKILAENYSKPEIKIPEEYSKFLENMKIFPVVGSRYRSMRM